MNELFDFGSRPIRVIELLHKFRFVHDKEGWVIATTTQAFDNSLRGDEVFDVRDVHGIYMGTVVDYGNLSALVSQIYDQQYSHMEEVRERHTKPEQARENYRWVVFAEITDGGENIANMSREVNAPNLGAVEEQFLTDMNAEHLLEDVEIITIYGPYMRA